MNQSEKIACEGLAGALRLLGVGFPVGAELWSLLLAIGWQESRLLARRQDNNGPARGLCQFERGGGVHGVLTHPLTQSTARRVCMERRCVPSAWEVWARLEHDDVLAWSFARLLLWTVPERLPLEDERQEGWRQYLSVWRPGMPHEKTWPQAWTTGWRLARAYEGR